MAVDMTSDRKQAESGVFSGGEHDLSCWRVEFGRAGRHSG
jgi:hypothetical protein